MRFTLNGREHELTRDHVDHHLRGVTPEPIRKLAVKIAGTWFPVNQAFEAATGVARASFISHTARRHLAALGYEVTEDLKSRGRAPAGSEDRPTRFAGPRRPATASTGAAGEWHSEANVQAALVIALGADGWRIVSVADTATRERGVDVVASRGNLTVGVEVKGFPSRTYADPARAGEAKRTSPSTQASHWFAQAVLAAMRLRAREPRWRSIIALPDFPRYRDLHAETVGSLAAAQIEVWWVDQAGRLEHP